MKTNFLGSAGRDGFHCTAKMLKLGRRLIFGVAECVDSNGRLLTNHTVTYIRVSKSRVIPRNRQQRFSEIVTPF